VLTYNEARATIIDASAVMTVWSNRLVHNHPFYGEDGVHTHRRAREETMIMMWSKDNFVIARHRFTCSSFAYDLLTTHHCVGPREHVSYQRSYDDIVAELAQGRDRARALACPLPSALCPPSLPLHPARLPPST
jgi:hypothetical protein